VCFPNSHHNHQATRVIPNRQSLTSSPPGMNRMMKTQHRPQQWTIQELPQENRQTPSHLTPTQAAQTETRSSHPEGATNQETAPRTMTRHTQTKPQSKSLPMRTPLKPTHRLVHNRCQRPIHNPKDDYDLIHRLEKHRDQRPRNDHGQHSSK
jgi:hypothetical protein